MKRSVLIIVALCVTLLFVAVLPVAASTSHPFRGNWRGIDAFDQSNITLQIVEVSRSGGQVLDIRVNDDRTGPWCGGPAEMRAIGVLEGDNSVAVSMVWWCLPAGSRVLYFYPDTLAYHPSTDTITSNDGTVYQRGR